MHCLAGWLAASPWTTSTYYGSTYYGSTYYGSTYYGSLSVDNLFVFLLIFRYFKVPPQLVDVCLNYGIFGSIVLRRAQG